MGNSINAHLFEGAPLAPLPTHPKLRWPLDLRVESYDGQRILIVNCPIGVSPEPLILVEAAAPLVSSMDGSLSLDDLYNKFAPYGVTSAVIDELVTLLDRGLFLATPGYFAAEKEMKERYLQTPVRPAALSGLGYPASKALLETEIDQFLESGTSILTHDPAKLICLKSPHIDYRRGGKCYGKTYSFLRGAPHDLYILIGTSHQYSSQMFHLTRKHFQNPISTLPCNTEFVDTLAKRYGTERSFRDEFLHKKEHSLELQIPFMSRLLGEPKIVPILVGGFYQMLKGSKLPQEYDEYEAFAASLAETLSEWKKSGRTFCFIAGVDMAHVGQHFGDAESLNPEFMEEIRTRDMQYLDAIQKQDKASLWSHIAEDSDARRICGFPTMYTIVDVLERLGERYSSDLYDYSQAVDYATDCAVTFAGMGMYSSKALS